MSPLSVSVVMLAVGMALAAEPAAAAGAQRPAAAAVPARGAEAPVVTKVLLVVSSEGRLDAKGEVVRPGFEMDEFAQAWLVLRANGVKVDVASPAGGAVVADRYSRQDDTIQAMERDPDALAALAATRRLQDVPVGEHAAVFVMGGKGAMFDLPSDAALARPLAAPHFKHPRFRLSLAKAHAALGAPQRSRELLQLVAGSDHSDAKARSEALELLARQPG